MRLTIKHQILLAPAAILLMLTLLLGFMQYTYWDLSVKRQEARDLRDIIIAIVEADMAAQRMNHVAEMLEGQGLIAVDRLEEVVELYAHLRVALERILSQELPKDTRILLQRSLIDLDPEQGFEVARYKSAVAELRPQLNILAEITQKRREKLGDFHAQNMDELVAQTTFISILVLGAAILLGIFLSLTFARRLLRRILVLSGNAARIAGGDLSPPDPPQKVVDELDDLTLSINRMTERLIRVVGAEKLLEGAEEERRRIAMDIHDQTLSDLSSVLRGIQALKAEQGCLADAATLEEDLQRAMTNLREVMDNLHPQTLEILGLGAALQSHLERHLAKDNLPEYHFYVSPEAESAELARLVRLTLYRIAVEAVHNVIKHARASRYEVNLDLRRGEMALSVEDNGVGFDPRTASSGGGRGLNNMRERALAIGARVTWCHSRFTSGTRFELVLPLNGAGKEV
jgi:signal transduction histidine kinase